MEVILKSYLDSVDKSLYWLSDESGVPYSTLHKFATGKTQSIHFATLEKIMDALEIQDINKIINRQA